MRSTRQWAVLVASSLAVVLAVGVGPASAFIMDNPDYQARWWGIGVPWEIIVNHLGVSDPTWIDGGGRLDVYNIALAPPWHKQVILEATFVGSAPQPQAYDKDLWLLYPGDIRYDYNQFLVQGSTWTIVWDLPSQQSHELLHFNSNHWAYDLVTQQGRTISYAVVATKCIPEPAMLALITLGGLALLQRR